MGRVEENKAEYKRLHRQTVLWTLFSSLLLCAVLFVGLLQGTLLTDEGMAPTLHAGEVLLFSRWSKYLNAPKRGDVFAVQGENGVSLGRVIALPGETVQLERGNVYINGIFLSESPYVQHADVNMDELTVPEGSYFLLPDSRAYMVLVPENMCVPAADLRGRALIRVSPLSRFGIFE